jgi:hypothetical protein
MRPGAVGRAGSAGPAGQVGLCTLGRARAAQMAVGNPKREGRGAQKARVVHVALLVRWAVCTRVGENGRVAQQAAEEVGRQTRARVGHEEAKRWTRDPGRGAGNAAGPVGAGNSQDKAHDGQTLVGCGAADGMLDGVELGSGVLDGHREEKVDDEDDVVVGVVAVVVVDDYEGTVVAAPVAGPVVAAAAAVVVVYA